MGTQTRAALLGQNLVRLLYMDEAGTTVKAKNLVVAAVMTHGDRDWPEIDRRVVHLIKKYITESDQEEFVFHATDIYHGARYFDRRKPEWADRNRRLNILSDLARIIQDLALPVYIGHFKKIWLVEQKAESVNWSQEERGGKDREPPYGGIRRMHSMGQ